MEEYLTVLKTARVEVEIERSRFIATIKRVESAKEASAFLESVKKEFSDATHNPFAYVTERGGYSRFSDDGEPSGTSGAPIMDVIKNAALLDTAIVVTRYFGGIKLGTGGLARAYGKTAAEVLRAAGTAKRTLCVKCEARLPYDRQSAFPKIAAGDGKVLSTEYLDEVVFSFVIKKSAFASYRESFTNAFSARYEIAQKGEDYFDL